MKEAFESRTLTGSISIELEKGGRVWNANKSQLVRDIISITTNYAKQGYRLTLRQLYYQLVAAEIPGISGVPNHDKVYKKIGTILDDCRYSGIIDWNSIEDRGRVPKLPYYVDGIKDALNDVINQYRLDRQNGQDKIIELWTEKDAISNILYRVTSKYHVRLIVNKGYTSSSAIYDAYKRFSPDIQKGKKVVILYFGDHDPSGLDMVRDIEDRLMRFFCFGQDLNDSDCEFYKSVLKDGEIQGSYFYDLADDDSYFTENACIRLGNQDNDPRTEDVDAFEAERKKRYIQEQKLFQVIPIGLKMDQIKKYKLPPNPAKITDPRAKDYIRKHGQISWEVDALRPDILTALVQENIARLIDLEAFNEILDQEKKEQKEIKKFAEKY